MIAAASRPLDALLSSFKLDLLLRHYRTQTNNVSQRRGTASQPGRIASTEPPGVSPGAQGRRSGPRKPSRGSLDDEAGTSEAETIVS
jgi:hypothetical protein